MSFRGLLYTDCRADESLRGGTGYQFQAASPAAQSTDEAVMLQELMYRPSPDLMAREAPVSDYPPSFAYFRTPDGYAMGAGKYLGQVSGDGRQGNQITHALFTDAADDLAGTRPAQLFNADVWVDEKQASKQLCEVDPPLLYRDEFDLPVLHKLASARGDAKDFLAQLISAFEGAAGDTWVKTILSCSDPQVALQWVALGTLLLPTEQALALSIRAFVTDPLSATQRIVAVHPPSMNKPPAINTIPAVSGIDLDTYTTSDISITERAAFWADRFIDGDPHEVVEAVELAGQLRASESANRMVASVAVLAEPMRSAAQFAAFAEVFETFEADDYDDFGDQLIDALEDAAGVEGLSPEPLMRLLPVVQRFAGATSEHQDRVQANVLSRGSGSEEFASRLIADTAWDWKWHSRPLPASAPSRALAATIGAFASGDLPRAFEFAARVGAAVDPGDLNDATQRLAEHWIRNPQLSGQYRRWLFGDRVLDLMVESLQAQAARGLPADVDAAAADGHWDWLLDFDWIVRGGGPLATEIAGRSIPKADPRRQEHLIRLIADSAGPGSWRSLWRNRSPLLPEVMCWLAAQPADVRDPTFASPAGQAVGAALDSGRISGRVLRLIDDLYAVAPDRLPRTVARIGQQNRDLSGLLAHVRSRGDDRGAGAAIAAMDPVILRIRMAEIVDAVVSDGDLDCLLDFLQKSRVDPTEQLIATLGTLANRFPEPTLQIAFSLSRNKLPKLMLKEIDQVALRWYESATEDTRSSVGKALHRDWPEWGETEERYERKHESTVKKVGRLFGRDKER